MLFFSCLLFFPSLSVCQERVQAPCLPEGQSSAYGEHKEAKPGLAEAPPWQTRTHAPREDIHSDHATCQARSAHYKYAPPIFHYRPPMQPSSRLGEPRN